MQGTSEKNANPIPNPNSVPSPPANNAARPGPLCLKLGFEAANASFGTKDDKLISFLWLFCFFLLRPPTAAVKINLVKARNSFGLRLLSTTDVLNPSRSCNKGPFLPFPLSYFFPHYHKRAPYCKKNSVTEANTRGVWSCLTSISSKRTQCLLGPRQKQREEISGEYTCTKQINERNNTNKLS